MGIKKGDRATRGYDALDLPKMHLQVLSLNGKNPARLLDIIRIVPKIKRQRDF
jgi:hypothetical protein